MDLEDAELALDEAGNFLGLRISTLANMGAYLSTFAPCIPTYLYATLLAGVYKTPQIYCEVKAVFTNTVPVDAYRGAGRPEATFLLERLVDAIAHDTGRDRIEIRRQNFIPSDAFPYQTPVALQYDSGDYGATLDACLAAADYAGGVVTLHTYKPANYAGGPLLIVFHGAARNASEYRDFAVPLADVVPRCTDSLL